MTVFFRDDNLEAELYWRRKEIVMLKLADGSEMRAESFTFLMKMLDMKMQ